MRTNTLFLALLLVSTAAFAEEPQPASPEKGFSAVMAGPSFATIAGGGTYFSYGVRVGFTVLPHPSALGTLGLAFTTMSKTATVGTLSSTGRITFLGAEYVARNAWGTGLYFGARAGLGLNGISVTGGTTTLSGSDTVFAFAPVAGFEARLSEKAFLLIDAEWLNVGGGTFALGGSSLPYVSTSFVGLHAGFGFSF